MTAKYQDTSLTISTATPDLDKRGWRNATPSQYVLVHCHGFKVLARLVGGGYAACPCGERIRVVA